MLRELGAGIDVCVTATLLDGVVVARSVYHHSLNYRSAVVLGHAWAGVIPLSLTAGAPVSEERVPAGVPVPTYASAYRRPFA